MKQRVRSWFLLFLLAGLSACESPVRTLAPQAEIGVFFGGQIQRVTSLEVSAVAPPRWGFRVTFPPAQEGDADDSRTIFYEIVRPGPAGRRVTEEGKLTLPASQVQLDQVAGLAEDAKMGVWNVRVVWKDQILADRAVYLSRPQL